MDDGAGLLHKSSVDWIVLDIVVPVFHRLKLDDKCVRNTILYQASAESIGLH